MQFLEVSGISVQEEGNQVLKDISFTQQEFSKITIAGETGSGKSTLLQTIAGLVQPSAGQIIFAGEPVEGPVEKLVPGHPEIAYLSQQFELPQFLRVEQVLKYANTLGSQDAEMLYEVRRIRHLLGRRTNQLSGGERQRIALAKLLISWPRLLLLDEPFSNLDNAHKNILKAVIRDIGEKLDITCILVSHDPQDTLSWAEEIIVLKNGQIIQKGEPGTIYRRPVNEYAAALFGSYNLIPAADTETLASLPDIHPNGKDMLVRPENFKIVTSESQALTGKVSSVTYFGSYYEVEVQIADLLIHVKATECKLKKGDTAYVKVAPENVCYL